MAITASSLIAPNGPIATVMFPGLGKAAVQSIVTARLKAAYADPRVVAFEDDPDDEKQDRLARPLAIYTTLVEEVYPRMLVEPNSVDVAEKGKSAYTDKQRSDFLAWANGFLATFEAELVVEDVSGRWGAGVAIRGS